MRDIATVQPGERVLVHLNPNAIQAGVFVGVVNNKMIVDHTVGYQHIGFDERRHVTDVDGNVLGTPEETKP